MEDKFNEIKAKFLEEHPDMDLQFPEAYAEEIAKNIVNSKLSNKIIDMLEKQQKSSWIVYSFLVLLTAKVIVIATERIVQSGDPYVEKHYILAELKESFGQSVDDKILWRAHNICLSPITFLKDYFSRGDNFRHEVDATIIPILQAADDVFMCMKEQHRECYILSYAAFTCSFLKFVRTLIIECRHELIGNRLAYWPESFLYAKTMQKHKDEYIGEINQIELL